MRRKTKLLTFNCKCFTSKKFLRSIDIREAPILAQTIDEVCSSIIEDKIPEFLRALALARYCYTAKKMSEIEYSSDKTYGLKDVFKIAKADMETAVKRNLHLAHAKLEGYMIRALYVFLMTYPTRLMKRLPKMSTDNAQSKEENHGN